MRNSFIHNITLCLTAAALLAVYACSTTSNLEDGEQLYTGMKPTVYENYEKGQHFIDTKAEIEAALACAPNGALFGSSYYKTPFPYGLWIYNAFSDKKGAISKWLTQTLGKAPVLMEDADPELRVSVGNNVLQNNGYFQGNIDYKIIEGKKGTTKTDSVPRVLSSKIAYTVNMGPLYKLDSIGYKGFTDNEIALINSTKSTLKKDDAFSVSNLDTERERIYNLFRDNGYYFFEKNYITYLADTLQKPQHVQLQICKVDSLPEDAMKQWKIDKRTFQIRRQMMEQITDSVSRRSLLVKYGGNKSPIRSRVVLQDVKLRSKQLFSQSNLTESMSRLTTKGIFSSTDISFTKSQATSETDSVGSLDMLIDCVLDKPYDFSMSANYTQKTSGRGGPGVGIGFAKRNAFRGGEILSLNLKGSAEFQMSNKVSEKSINYDLGADLTLEMPRLLLPNFLRKRRRWYIPPSTLLSISYNRINRSGFFRRNVFSSEMTYLIKPTQKVTHTFTPLSISFTRLVYRSQDYINKMKDTGVGLISLSDYLSPQMRYTYSYSTRGYQDNPITLSATVAEAGNATVGLLSMFSKKEINTEQIVYNDGDIYENRTEAYCLFHTPITQYLKFETDFVKSWRTGSYSKLLAHVFAGYIYNYGNTDKAPFSDLYYAGGANDLRGFGSRCIGPGNFTSDDSKILYMMSTGNLKLTCNLEYRPRLFGSLYGALFVDAGNVWGTYWKDYEEKFKCSMTPNIKNLGNEIAVDAGVGIRYDLDFFVIRLDWGFIVHAPYNTGKSGYFNFPSFKKGQCINFAIGYPF